MKLLLFIFFTAHIWSFNMSSFEIHAHRGGSSKYQENSLNALLDGLSKNVQFVELDLHLTYDNIFIITHDPVINFKRCKSSKKLSSNIIKNLTLKEIKTIHCQKNKKLPIEPIATLEELLTQAKDYFDKGKKLNLEVKFHNSITKESFKINPQELYPSVQTITHHLHKILTKHNMYNHVIIQSFSPKILIQMQKFQSKVTTSYLYRGPLIISFFNRKLYHPNYKQAYEIMKKNHFNYFAPNYQQISLPFFNHYFKKYIYNKRNEFNFKIIIWTINSVESFKNLYEKYLFDGVISDVPEKFQSF